MKAIPVAMLYSVCATCLRCMIEYYLSFILAPTPRAIATLIDVWVLATQRLMVLKLR